MATYSTNLGLTLITTGDEAGTWGTTTNTNLGTLLEQSISGYTTQAVATGTDTTITIPNGATGIARNMFLELTGTGGASTNLIVPTNKKLYFIYNNTAGAVTVKVSGQTGVSVPAGMKVSLVCNGTDVVSAVTYFASFSAAAINNTPIGATTPSTGAFTTLSASSNVTIAAPSSGQALTVNAALGSYGATFASTAANQAGIQLAQSGQTAVGIFNPASTNNLALSVGGSTRMQILSSGEVSIGVTPAAGINLFLGKTITGATSAYGIRQEGQIQSDVTGMTYYYSVSNVAVGTSASVAHYTANQGTITGTMTSQTGYWATANLTAATNNYGFLGSLSSGTGRWNLYMAGTADNYIAGSLGIGTSAPKNELEIVGSGSPRLSIRSATESVSEAQEIGFGFGTGINASSNTVAVISAVTTQADPSALKGGLVFSTNRGDSVTTAMTLAADGNVTIAAPASGATLALTPFTGATAFSVSGDSGAGSAASFNNTSATDPRSVLAFSNNLTTAKSYTIGLDGDGVNNKAFTIRDATASVVRLSIGTTGVVTVAGNLAAAAINSTPIGSTTTSTGAFTTLTGTSSVIGSPTGGNQGAGTLNATGLYVNGVAVGTGSGTVTSVAGTGTVNGLTLTGTVTSSGSLTLGGTLSLVSPPAIGSTTPSTGAFTTLAASSTVSGTGFSTYLASPPAIGGTAPSAGAFTTLAASSSLSVGGVAVVTTARTVSVSGTGLSGGGDLSANRTITIDQTAMKCRNLSSGGTGTAMTAQSGGTASGGADGDIILIY